MPWEPVWECLKSRVQSISAVLPRCSGRTTQSTATRNSRVSRAHFLRVIADVIPKKNMRITNILIFIIWSLFLYDAVQQGLAIPASHFVTGRPPLPAKIIWPFGFFGMFILSFYQRKSKLKLKVLSRFIDPRFSPGTVQRFIDRLRPMIMFMIGCLVLGITGILSSYYAKSTFGAYSLAGFFLAGGLGLLASYTISTFITKDRNWV